VSTFQNLEQEWRKYRARLEREIRVLVVHDDAVVREELDRLLFRHRISARTVDGGDGVQELVGRDHYSLVMIASHLFQLQDFRLPRQLRRHHPEVDLLLLSQELDVDLVRQCIDLGVLDLVNWPVADGEEVCDRIKAAVRRNVDRRMRAHVLHKIREELDQLDRDSRFRVTAALEHRLEHFKRWIGGFNRALVVECADPGLRHLSENLLVAGLDVEAAELPEEGWDRIEQGGLHLVVMKAGKRIGPSALARLRQADPLTELVLVSRDPTLAEAVRALREGVALFLQWPPLAPLELVHRIDQIRQESRRSRLLDSLLAALFWEMHGVLQGGAGQSEAYQQFCRLAGMERELPVDAAVLTPRSGSTDPQVMEDVVDHILGRDSVPPVESPPPPTLLDPGTISDHERRAHYRVQENQFVRFRPDASSTSILAYLGDISEGGVFLRTQRLQARGTTLLVDVNVEHEGLGYLVRCKGEVAWVARTSEQVPYGPGFGVKFVNPPADVKLLLKRVVLTRVDP